MPDIESDLAARVALLERKLRIAFVVATVGLGGCALAVTGGIGDRASAASAPPQIKAAEVLRVRELDVVDPNGTTRVRIGAPLPNAVVDGRTLTRGGALQDTMSGILLYDADGTERSGYATVDRGYSNVLLTLDGKHQQHAMFIAEPDGTTTLRLFNQDTKDRLDVAIDKDGPAISMTRRGQQIYRSGTNAQ